MIWLDGIEQKHDYYVAFRGTFELDASGEAEIRLLGSGWFGVCLDGEWLAEGPLRYHTDFPEHETYRVMPGPGRHVLAALCHHIGIDTRILADQPPFFHAPVVVAGNEIPVQWKAIRLPGYQHSGRRINPQLGWIEYCDTRLNPADWELSGFDDTDWAEPIAVTPAIGESRPATIAPVKRFPHVLKPVAEGPAADRFCYDLDDPPLRFFLRDLACDEVPPQGVWRRYDLGRVRLFAPRFTLDLPPGAVVQFGYGELLRFGRVSPHITASAGMSANMDHYVARGGVQTFQPLTPKGGRYLEVHILAEPDQVRFIEEGCVERGYHGPAQGAFSCDDALLDTVWSVGVETYRACAEDAVIDNPTRERGQWTGDVTTVGMDIAAVAYDDVRLLRRGLVQSAQDARPDGLVAGMAPGGSIYLSTYAAQWVTACMRYYELTGDRSLLEEMYPRAVANLRAFEAHVGPNGLSTALAWPFVDWGYPARAADEVDPALNFHYRAALLSMADWCRVLGREPDAAAYEACARSVMDLLGPHIARVLADDGWGGLGYHTAVMALRNGLFSGEHERACIDYVKAHIMSCFPNDSAAPRLSDPTVTSTRLITPYFAHYAFPPLIERGEMDFILGQYRTCWGWALKDGITTWIEVFDTRWSHCHQWSGCPTWQLSRYALGLHPRFDIAPGRFVFRFHPGSLGRASGVIPLPGGERVEVTWTRDPGAIHYKLRSTSPVTIDFGKDDFFQGDTLDRDWPSEMR